MYSHRKLNDFRCQNSISFQLMMESVKNVFFYILILIFSAFAVDEESHSRLAYFTTREINDFKATLWSGMSLPVWYRAASCVWETVRVLPQTSRSLPRRTTRELVNLTSTISPSSMKTPSSMIRRTYCFLAAFKGELTTFKDDFFYILRSWTTWVPWQVNI